MRLTREKRTLINERATTKEMAEKEVGEMFLSLVQDIATELDLGVLCHKILVNVGRLTCADRGSLFLVEQTEEAPNVRQYLVPKLFDVTVESDVNSVILKATEEALPIPFGTGIAGHVAQTKTALRIVDAYRDPRFHIIMDQKTGYRTRSIICLPILNHLDQVVGVAELVNKKDPIGEFTEHDEQIFRRYLSFAGIGIQNARLFARVKEEQQRNQVLLALAESIFQEQTSLEKLVQTMMTHAHNYLKCQRTALYVITPSEKDEMVICKGFEFLPEDDSDGGCGIQTMTGPLLQESPYTDLAQYVAKEKKVLRLNNIGEYIQERSQLAKLLRAVPIQLNQLLSLPIYNARSAVVGVVQLMNKVDGTSFTTQNTSMVEAFALFSGMAIHNTQTYEEVCKLSAKQKVALECLSYHARASEEEVDSLKNQLIPPADFFNLTRYDFNDFALSDVDTCKSVIRMFIECDLINRFRIPYEVLCRWILSVKKNYRPVKYHNWRHAVNVAQTMFSLMKTGHMEHFLNDLDVLSLLVACLCHDLDHRGTNNAFQSKVMSPLAVLYSTSTMEHHHLDECIMILSEESNNILQSLTPDEYKRVMYLIEYSILSTDLAVYFRKKNQFIGVVEIGEWNWQDPVQKELLIGMVMTSCDVSAIAKPWEVQHRVAKLVAEEFFEQGDIEKLQLNETPIAMMDRDQQDNLPKMQIGFIDSICLPLYKALAESFPWVRPLYDSCLENRRQWGKLAELVDMGLTWIDHSYISKPVEQIAGSKDMEKLPLIVTELSSSKESIPSSTKVPSTVPRQNKELKSILKLPKPPQASSAPVSPEEETSCGKSLIRMRSMSLDTRVSSFNPIGTHRCNSSKMCSIS